MPEGTGWTAHEDDEGRVYYYDGENTSWDKPNWTAYKDENGDTYYCHENGESSWEVPQEDFLEVEEEAMEEETAGVEEGNVVNGENGADSYVGEEQEGKNRPPTSKEDDSMEIEVGVKEEPSLRPSTESPNKDDSNSLGLVKKPDNDPANDAPESPARPESPSIRGSPSEKEQPNMFDGNVNGGNQDQRYEWSAFKDEEGRIYYHNDKTGESAWDPPAEGFNPPPDDEEANDPLTTTAAAKAGKWVAYTDDEGRTYYYNEETGETQWEVPEEFEARNKEETAPVEMETDKADEDPRQEKIDDGEAMVNDASMELEDEKKPPEKSPLETAEEMLSQPDSVLEPDCKRHADIVVAANDGDPQKAMTALITNYRGQAAICGLLGKWLTELKRPPDSIREVCREVIGKTIKDRFSKDVADEILNLSKSEAAFLGGMMDSSEWRKVLIDLTVKHKDSAVLLYCLRGISKRGHHREIAKRINQSEHFAVFNAMVASELSVIGSQAVSAGSDLTSALHLRSLVSDLCRSCTSTGYTYMYSLALLKTLDRMACDDGSAIGGRLRLAVSKWRALAEEFEAGMMDPTFTQSSGTSSHLLRKRRLEVALSFGDLRVSKRGKIGNGESGASNLNNALAALISRYSMGIQLDEGMLDSLLPQGLSVDTRGVGELMNRYPLSIKALLGHLYKPGATRVSSPSMRSKCARLVALAADSATNTAFDQETSKTKHLNEDGELPTDATEEPGEVALTRMIVDGSKCCEVLETTVAFHVFKGCDDSKALTTGQKLYALALKCAPVSLGVMMWAKEHTKGRDFSSSASFPTVSSSILSLVRLVAINRPATRRDALEIAITFITEHSNSEISYKKINSIRENALRLMIVLLAKGEVVMVLEAMIGRLENRTSSDIDASLIRYFVFGITDVVKGPFSPVFVLLFARLLSLSKVSDALKSSYVTKENTQRLRSIISLFPKTMERRIATDQKVDEKYVSIQSLRQTYGVSE